jgi:hypothetical protein
MSGTWGKYGMYPKFKLHWLMTGEKLGNLGTDGRIILKSISKQHIVNRNREYL